MQFRSLLRNQEKIIDLGLDAKDILIANWIIEMHDRKIHVIDDKFYFEINASEIIRDLPILGITNKEQISRRLKRLCESNFLESVKYKNKNIYRPAFNLNLIL